MNKNESIRTNVRAMPSMAYLTPYQRFVGHRSFRTSVNSSPESDSDVTLPVTKHITAKEFIGLLPNTQGNTTASDNTTTNGGRQLYKLVGWVRKTTENAEKTGTYIEVVDGTSPSHVSVVVWSSHPNYGMLRNVNVGDAITVIGMAEKKLLKTNLSATSLRLVVDGREEGHSVSLHPSFKDMRDLDPVGLNGIYPMTYLREHVNFRSRNAVMQAIFRIRSAVTEGLYHIMKVCHVTGSLYSLQKRSFINVTTPLLTTVNCEGMGDIFEIDRTFLSVSGQLELEALCSGFSRVWKLGPAFRADRSDTPRHLCEFWMLEAEMVGPDLKDLINVIHQIIIGSARTILDNCRDDILLLERHFKTSIIKRLETLVGTGSSGQDSLPRHLTDDPNYCEPQPIHTLEYKEALSILNRAIETDESYEHSKLEWGDQLSAAHERSLLSILESPLVAVVQYPRAIAPFYMQQLDGGVVNNVDIFAEGVGEIAGGSIREVNYPELEKSMQEHGVYGKDYAGYLELRKFGNVPHGGFGIGFERMIMFLLGIQNIKDVIHFPKVRRKHYVE
uniref:Asparaginyl-tRNA synthetase, putative n=1 Tax=Babesia bovis TaxID=5865 RepID=A7ARY8_BABBO|eukprot:XP_001610875.1 asparaginyl-tRNA synthetase [Babesia bovis T2Bo]